MQSITYSHVDSLDIKLDLHLPPELAAGPVPALVHFHRGGMMAGSRKTLASQHWLKGMSFSLFYFFPPLSPPPKLLSPPPKTGWWKKRRAKSEKGERGEID